MNKIVIAIAVTILSSFLGLFILPQQVETTRWVQVETPEDIVWKEISDPLNWNQWQPWADGESGEVPWDGGVVSVTKVDAEIKKISFDVVPQKGRGELYLEKVPEGLWIRCYYTYSVDYAPWSRLQGWMRRSDVALKIDAGLEKLQQTLVEKP